MPYEDLTGDVVFNEISEEDLHSQENLPPNQYWLTPEEDETLNIFPIGFYFISENPTSPSSLYGGVWEELPEGYTLWSTTIASANAGTTIDAGLPNITGTLGLLNHPQVNTRYDGAFSQSGSASNTHTGMNSNSRTYTNAYFDASKSNSIYGSSSTVQPPARRVYMWKRIA